MSLLPKRFHRLFLAAPLLLLLFLFFRHQEEATYFPRLEDPPPSAETANSVLEKSEERYSKDSNDLKALVDQGVAHFFLGKDHYAQALNAFNSAWQAGALDKRIFYYSGILYERLSLFEQSRKQYERFLRHEPKDREVRLRLARLLFRIEKWDDAIGAYQEFVKENPNDGTSLINCGLAYQKKAELIVKKRRLNDQEKQELQSNQKEAIRYLELARNLPSGLPEDVSLVLAKLYFDSNQWGSALSLSQGMLAKQQNSLDFLKIAGSSYEKLNQKKEALESYKKIVELNSKDSGAKQKVRILSKSLKIR